MGRYEWKEGERANPTTGGVSKAMQPYPIRPPDREPIAFAGVMSQQDAEGDKTLSVSSNLSYSCCDSGRAILRITSAMTWLRVMGEWRLELFELRGST
jgi:putative SOS response-associated peptidase YedK